MSEKALAVRRAAAKLPRPNRLTKDLREVMRTKLVPLLMGPGAERIARMISGGSRDFDEFKWACEFVANRLGLPIATQQDLAVTGMGREVVVVEGGLGWPGVKGVMEAPEAVPGDHDDRSEQPTVQ